MKRTIYLLVGMLVLFTGCKNYDDDIARIDNVLEQMKNSSITSIEQQITHISTSLADLKKVDAELEALILSLEGGDAEHSEFLKALQAKDAELDRKIADLQAYLDGEIKTTEDWATATFATLEQYADMQKEIASLKSLINGIDTGISVGQLNAAISSSETSMKTWVNSVLADGYYDIATIDAKLDAIRASISYYDDTELREAIEAQKNALTQAKAALTSAYKKAIADAIEKNKGVIDDAIAAAITAATTNLQNEIANIKSEITSIKSRLDALEKNFANRIQSLVFVPQYSDGKILMDYTDRTTQAHFRISPAAIAKLIEVKNVEAFARYTNDPTTRAYEPEFPLVVESVTGDETGMLEVNLKENSENLFDTDFWAGKKEAVIYIQITDENGNNVVSDAIPMMAHGYGSNEGNRVYGFGDGKTYTGEITE